MRKSMAAILFILLPVVVIGGMALFSRDITKRNREFPTQMEYSPAYLSQTANPVLPNKMTLQPPVAGTIPRGFTPFHYGATPEEAIRAGSELVNPFQATPENLARGQYIYTNSCAVCHGTTGAGDGPVIPKFPNPPSYLTDAAKALPDGTMFHVITMGRNNMASYAAQVSAEDRWKVVLYIRSLQGK